MMNTRFMYNFKKVGNEYVPERNRLDYDYIVAIKNIYFFTKRGNI